MTHPQPQPRASPASQLHDPFDEEHRIETTSPSPSTQSKRFDSGVEVSPTSLESASLVQYTSFDAASFRSTSLEDTYSIYPPLITGHGRLLRARQTIPAWLGVLVVLGLFAWTVWCALHVSLLGGHR
ncbi:hypothetical protein CC80DRAFT_17784 [Byssothecium circinans]|uniref:Uncharacterized protein n=1 Tax=Byssothecium circinans TaxID=147558 RepID=A0A6A5U4D5_9PLEO|nr:hypothetical protein CC80DRAFT_17784 [Byssothecium circinans]